MQVHSTSMREHHADALFLGWSALEKPSARWRVRQTSSWKHA